jgi:hypothetical protein
VMVDNGCELREVMLHDGYDDGRSRMAGWLAVEVTNPVKEEHQSQLHERHPGRFGAVNS